MESNQRKNKKDYFQKAIHKNLFTLNNALSGPELYINCSYDKYNELLQLLDKLEKNYPLSISLYDEERSLTDENYLNIQKIIKALNNKRVNSLNLYMSDATMPIYNLYMYHSGWIHQDKTKLFLSLDRHPLKEKRLNLQYATGQIMMPEEKLLWVPKFIFRQLDDRINPRVFEETKKLRRFLDNYNMQIKRTYKYQELTDIEKTLIVYDDIRKSICYASDRTTIFPGKSIHAPITDKNNWQARLMVCMLNNPEMMVDACTINGLILDGKRHTWVGIHTNDKLYECCPTMQEPFRNLKNKGYIPDQEEQYINTYKRSFLTDKEYTKVCKGILEKRR